MTDLLDCIEIDTAPNPLQTVIWLHGLGADGNDFASIVPELAPGLFKPTRFIFPHAPERPITINQGATMRAWFDIVSLDAENRYNEEEIKEAMASIHALIDEEVKRECKVEKIILAGFSQGGALALLTGLAYPKKLAGIVALSTYLTQDAIDMYLPNPTRTPVFYAHGKEDDIIDHKLGRATYIGLRSKSIELQWQDYPIGHTVSSEEIQDIGRWLQTRFG